MLHIRELRNVLERSALLCDRPLLTARDLRLTTDEPARGPRGTPEPVEVDIVRLEENEPRYLVRVLARKHGRVEEVARALDVPLSFLSQRLERLGITLGDA